LRYVTSFLPFYFFVVIAACSGPPTAEELEVWIRAAQFTKVEEFVVDANNPQQLRVRALELLVEYGRLGDMRNTLSVTPDRPTIVDELVIKLQQNLESSDDDLQLQSESGLIQVVGFLSEEKTDKVLSAIAEWAFEGLTEETPRDELKAQLDMTVANDLDSMGRHGLKVASWLIAYGIESKRFVSYMAREAKTDDDRKLLLNAVRKNLQLVGPEGQVTVIDNNMIQALIDDPIPETVGLLVDVYMNDAFNATERNDAFGLVQGLIRQSDDNKLLSTSAKRSVVVDALRPALKSTNATDRWDAIDLILKAGGSAELSTAMDGLQDDLKSYDRWTDDQSEREGPERVIAEICTRRLGVQPADARKALEARLQAGNRYQKAFVILCLKVVGNDQSIQKLKVLSSDETSLESFFFTKKMRKVRTKRIKSNKIPQLTVGLLANNTMEGIRYISAISKREKAKKISKDEAQVRRDAVLGAIQYIGPQLKSSIQRRILRLRAEMLAGKAWDKPSVASLLKLIKSCSPKAKGRDGCAVSLENCSDIIADETGSRAVDTDEKKKRLNDVLRPLLEAESATTRWGASELLLKLGGGGELGAVLGGLKTNLRRYGRRTSGKTWVTPDQVIAELCEQHIAPLKDSGRAALESTLSSKSLLAVGFSVLCLKTLGNAKSITALERLANNTKSLEDVLFAPKERKNRQNQLKKEEIERLTVGGLAANAVAGIGLLNEIEKATAAGKITAKKASSRREIVLAYFDITGDYYRKSVEYVWKQQEANK